MMTTHSIMFHHFHNQFHSPAQGSMSADEFENMLDWLCNRYVILSASDYLLNFENGTLKNHHICLSLDDGLLSQWDVAAPILKKRNIQAFFFAYSSVFTGSPNYLEIFRYFRSSFCKSIEEFYALFFDTVKGNDEAAYLDAKQAYRKINYLGDYPFYTESDKWFRYLRDQILGVEDYTLMMQDIMKNAGFNPLDIIDILWMNEEHMKALSSDGHMIGLHSHNHPVRMSKLSYKEQASEYLLNLEHLESTIGKGKIVSVSHPCGDYNNDTLKILKDMGIRIGFRSAIGDGAIRSALEIPREDQANIYHQMRIEKNNLWRKSA